MGTKSLASSNPFQVLGLSPEVIRILTDEEIGIIVKTQYRALQQIFHPDKKGKEETSKQINQAYEYLDQARNPETYAYYKKRYLARRGAQSKIQELEDKLRHTENNLWQQYKQMQDYFSSILEVNKLTVFNAAGHRFQMHDTGLQIFVPKNKEMNKILFFTLIVNDDQTITKEVMKNQYKFANKKLIGTIDDGKAREHGGITTILKRAQNIWSKYDDALARLLQTQRDKATPVRREVTYYSEKIEPQRFQAFTPLLTPRITKNSYLFSINKDGGEFYSLEGKILKAYRAGAEICL